MFTGIVRSLGRVTANARGRLRVSGRLGRLPLGASVAVNGVCLTVVRRAGGTLDFETSPETLRRTNLGALKPEDPVNLEPALRASDPIGGHWVSGHVDAPARVLESEDQPGGFRRVRISLPASLLELVAVKGSIAVDGTSLTVTGVGKGWFETVLVPHTLERTTLGARRPGDAVNLEADLLARYLQRLLRGSFPARAPQRLSRRGLTARAAPRRRQR
ncbi:MAG: riboflavin synthase [Elusimicrobia bacterium]|nr:riboflavin synthase [Elusimicrobiota bacterium]